MILPMLCLLYNAIETVTLERNAAIWTLRNELVEVVLNTRSANVTEFRFRDGDNVLVPLGATFDFNEAGGFYGTIGSEGNPTIESPRVCSQTDEYIDVAVRAQMYDPQTKWKSPLVFDWHIVLQAGDPGFYTYLVAKHKPDEGEMKVGQLRFIVWTANRFRDYALTPSKMGHLKDHEWKYTLTRSWEPWNTHGLVAPDTKEGLWTVYASKSWCRGPEQRDLTLHDDSNSGIGVLLTMLEAGHYGVFPTSRPSGISIHEGWNKVYGPIFYMLTKNGTTQEMYEQASEHAEYDLAKFPPSWLSDTIGHLTKVKGRISPNQFKDDVRVVINNDRYTFWATCKSRESFEIANVIPGKYKLIARQGSYANANINELNIGENAYDIGEIDLIPSIPSGEMIWEMGKPDDSCEEFLGGQHCWQFKGYEYFTEEVREPLIYKIGESKPDIDWYWIHPGPIDEWAGSKIHPWTIQFRIDTIPEKPLLLHIVLADTMSALHIPPSLYYVGLNGKELANFRLSEGGQAGSYCVASVGVPQHYKIIIQPESFIKGINNLVLYPDEQSYVMYDYIALQKPE